VIPAEAAGTVNLSLRVQPRLGKSFVVGKSKGKWFLWDYALAAGVVLLIGKAASGVICLVVPRSCRYFQKCLSKA
jgi:hypothetical protein